MNFILLGRGEPERVETGVVSWNYFDVFGVKPLFGRAFRPEDEQPGAPAVLMLSYEYWIRSFGGDPTVVNKTVHDERPAAHGRGHPAAGAAVSGRERRVHADDGVSFRSRPSFHRQPPIPHDASFRPHEAGISVRQARADLNGVAANLQQAYPKDYRLDGLLHGDILS